jgi:hypothetical protein
MTQLAVLVPPFKLPACSGVIHSPEVMFSVFRRTARCGHLTELGKQFRIGLFVIFFSQSAFEILPPFPSCGI